MMPKKDWSDEDRTYYKRRAKAVRPVKVFKCTSDRNTGKSLRKLFKQFPNTYRRYLVKDNEKLQSFIYDYNYVNNNADEFRD